MRTVVISAAAFAALAIAGARTPHATTPCPAFFPATLTGTLIEVRQGDTLIENEEAIQAGALRRVCVTSSFADDSGRRVSINDCETETGWPMYTLTASP